jgi:RsiW-degrading membrane proteinase PrsW (M82 family)
MILALAVALVAPLALVIVLVDDARTKVLLLLLSWGALSGVAAAYTNTWLLGALDIPLLALKVEFAPLVEELLKALPLFFLFVFTDRYVEDRTVILGAIFAGLGFSIVENYSYMIESARTLGSNELLRYVLLRSFSTTIMHALATGIIGLGLFNIRRGTFEPFGFSNTFAFVAYSFAVLLHALFNLLVQFQTLGRTAAIGTVIILYLGAYVFFDTIYTNLATEHLG